MTTEKKQRNPPAIPGYKRRQIVGKGTFGQVFLSLHISTNCEVALKMIDKKYAAEQQPTAEAGEKEVRKLQLEVDIMKKIDHPNIERVFEVQYVNDFICLVLEYCDGGELQDFILGRVTKYNKPPSEKTCRAKFRQMLSAVEYLHYMNIAHRDLKAENFLLCGDSMEIKLADFGFATTLKAESPLMTHCGSLPYAAPELIDGKKCYEGPPVDIWSLGVLLYYMVAGKLPFDSESQQEVMRLVRLGKYKIPHFMSKECEDILKKMIKIDPTKRSSAEQLMKHKWVNIGWDDTPLQPYRSSQSGVNFKNARIEKMHTDFGYDTDSVFTSLKERKYDSTMATYLLLGKLEETELRRRVPVVESPGATRPADRRRTSTPGNNIPRVSPEPPRNLMVPPRSRKISSCPDVGSIDNVQVPIDAAQTGKRSGSLSVHVRHAFRGVHQLFNKITPGKKKRSDENLCPQGNHKSRHPSGDSQLSARPITPDITSGAATSDVDDDVFDDDKGNNMEGSCSDTPDKGGAASNENKTPHSSHVEQSGRNCHARKPVRPASVGDPLQPLPEEAVDPSSNAISTFEGDQSIGSSSTVAPVTRNTSKQDRFKMSFHFTPTEKNMIQHLETALTESNVTYELETCVSETTFHCSFGEGDSNANFDIKVVSTGVGHKECKTHWVFLTGDVKTFQAASVAVLNASAMAKKKLPSRK